MTRVDELAAERIELNPDVPFPPFPLWISVPSGWSPLDSNPGTWRRSADELIDTTFRGVRLPARERREIVGFLEGLVADCQRAGAAVSLITVGRREVGGAVSPAEPARVSIPANRPSPTNAASFGLHVAFTSDGRAASLGRVHDILPRTGTASEINTAAGPGVLHRDRMTMMVPGTAQVAALTSIQIFVPLPGTSWTVVLSTASAYPDLTDPLEALVRSVAESIRTRPEDAPDEPSTDRASTDEPSTEFTATTPATAPGFERGFGTLVQRHLEPRNQPEGPRP